MKGQGQFSTCLEEKGGSAVEAIMVKALQMSAVACQ